MPTKQTPDGVFRPAGAEVFLLENGMTYRDVFTQILCEASGKSKKEIDKMAEVIFSAINKKTKIDDEISADKAENLMALLRGDLGGVRRWLAEGGIEVAEEIRLTQGTKSTLQH